MKTIFNGDAEDATRTLFDLIGGGLRIVEWETKVMVMKTKMDRVEAKAEDVELIDVIKRNKDA